MLSICLVKSLRNLSRLWGPISQVDLAYHKAATGLKLGGFGQRGCQQDQLANRNRGHSFQF
jgi:hypothetical protein